MFFVPGLELLHKKDNENETNFIFSFSQLLQIVPSWRKKKKINKI